MFTGAVDTGKGLFVQQAHKSVLFGNFLHHFHRQLVVIRRDVGGGEDRRHFVLCGGNFIVLGLCQHAQLPEFFVQIFHIRLHAGLDGAEIMVVQLLPFGGSGTEQRAAGVNEILALFIHGAVNEKILLLRSYRGFHGMHIRIAEECQYPHCLPVDGFHGAQQSRFLIQRLAAVGAEHGRNAQHAVLDKGIRSCVPRGVAACLKRGAKPAGGEGGSVRLALNQLLARKLHNDLAAVLGGNKAVVLLGSHAGHRLKPVGKVRGAALDCPVLHRVGNNVRHRQVKVLAAFNGFLQCLKRFLG